MKLKDFELLQALHTMTEIRPNLLTNEAFNVYNKLADQADSENLIW